MLPTLNTNMGNANAEQEALTTSTVEDEPRPRFGLKRRFGTSSFLAAAFALCLVKLSYDVVVTEALTGVNQVFDPYLLCFLEILEVCAGLGASIPTHFTTDAEMPCRSTRVALA